MKKTSPITRILAAVALVTAVVLVFVVVSGSTGTDDDGGNGKASRNPAGKKESGDKSKSRTKAKKYEVKEGDTLTGIAQKTGIPVDEIQALNPDLDPQALQAGTELKLR
ncbi:MAG: LysM peptidoglycan-binding domain-containing protein [Solirubrobacterales bacterium]